MNITIHPVLAVPFAVAILCKGWCLCRLMPRTHSTHFMLPFVMVQFVWGIALFGLSTKGYAYFIAYWTGAYVTDFLACCVVLQLLLEQYRKSNPLWNIIAVSLVIISMYSLLDGRGDELQAISMVTQLLVLGLVALCWLQKRSTSLVQGFMVLYFTGWLIACCSSVEGPMTVASPLKKAEWALGFIVDAGVYAWWAMELRVST